MKIIISLIKWSYVIVDVRPYYTALRQATNLTIKLNYSNKSHLRFQVENLFYIYLFIYLIYK